MYLVKAHHGTTLKFAENICSNGFNIVHKDYHWLGPGAYFWQDAPLRAFHWAKNYSCNENSEEAAVVEVDINLSHSIDLLDIAHWAGIRKTYNDMINKENLSLEQNSPTVLSHDNKVHSINDSERHEARFVGYNTVDCELIKRYTMDLEDNLTFDVSAIRCAFLEGKEIFLNSFFYDFNHVQIAVLSNDAIIGEPRILDSNEINQNYQIAGHHRWPVTPK